jgi:hypothetical protein
MEREYDRSSPSSIESKNVCSFIAIPPYPSMVLCLRTEKKSPFAFNRLHPHEAPFPVSFFSGETRSMFK